MEAQSYLSSTKTDTKKPRFAGLSDAFIIFGLSIIVLSLVFNWMATYDNPPELDDFSEFNDPSDAYQNALENHQDKIRGYEGIYSLFSSVGVVILVGGLFYKTVSDSNHLPDWVRVAMMIGVLYFMIRLFTTDLSLMDQIELIALVNS
jgi:hypothetical protein